MYELYRNQDERSYEETSKEVLKSMQSAGIDTLPVSEALAVTLNTIQPTSKLAERAVSQARKFRRYCKERQDDQRFTNYFFLKDSYQESEPWHKAGNSEKEAVEENQNQPSSS